VDARQAREAGTILAELAPLIQAECARAVSAGQGASGTGFDVDVLVGDEYLDKHKNASRGKVVLTMGEVSFVGRAMRPNLTEICNASPSFEIHIWTPAERQDRTDPLSGAQRINAHLGMVECIVRAIFGTHHGANAPAVPPVERLTTVRDLDVLRHGQASVLTFPMVLAIFEGQPLTTLPDGSSIASRYGSTSDPTPPVGTVAGSIIVNPED